MFFEWPGEGRSRRRRGTGPRRSGRTESKVDRLRDLRAKIGEERHQRPSRMEESRQKDRPLPGSDRGCRESEEVISSLEQC